MQFVGRLLLRPRRVVVAVVVVFVVIIVAVPRACVRTTCCT
jgi:hypothetical protein